jgi:hypothetical protein
MKKLCLLTSVAFFCCFAGVAQQKSEPTDSAVELQQSPADGEASVFVSFSAVVKDLNKVSLQWDVTSAVDGDYFIIERSADGSRYETVGALRKEEHSNHYELLDIAPPNGADLYRIRYTSADGRLVYSKTAQVSLSSTVDFKFYPNPVDKLLIIRTAHPVDIQIIDAGGSIRVVRRLTPGIQVINISSLERGTYVLRVADKESNRIISSQLLKN